MNQYRVCLIAPSGYIHAACFKETAFLVKSSIDSLGLPCDLKLNELAQDRINIVIGYHLMQYGPHLNNYRYIAYQFEQLTARDSFYPENSRQVLLHAETVWDYSQENVAFLKAQGITARHVPLGHHKNLEQIKHVRDKDVDVLFYGCVAPGGRREALLNKLQENRNVNVKALFGVYGKERDEWIGRSKIVLNLHHFSSQIFEAVRVSYLLNNGCFVVSETSNDYPYPKIAMPLVPYDNIIGSVMQYLKNGDQIESLRFQMYEDFKSNYPMEGIVGKVLTDR